MDEGSRPERIDRRLGGQPCGGEAAQLVIDQGEQMSGGAVIPENFSWRPILRE